MKCENCGVKDARINLIKVSGEEKSNVWLCDDCAKDFIDIPSVAGLSSDVSIQNLLNTFIQSLSKNNKNEELDKLICSKCGLTYKEFKKKGLLGCSECYKVFSAQLRPVIKRIHGDLEHIGKVPKRTGKELIKLRAIRMLKEELQKAVIEEAYEDAAIIRDKIKSLEKGGDL